jgi:hypothetical protein
MMRRQRLRCALALLALLVAASPARAFFERIHAGARSIALGRAYGAMADDASAPYWNPAALVTLRRGEILFTFARPLGATNLQGGYASAVLPRDGLSWSFSWHHLGVSDVVGENLVSVGAARDLLPPGGRFALAVGANLKLAHVGFAHDYGREVHVTADLGVLLNVTTRLAFSYTVRNLTQPEFEFVPGQGGTRLRRTQDLGFAYYWNPASTVALALSQDAAGEWTLNAGGEVWFYDVFALRSGLAGEAFTGGVGLKTARYLVDFSFSTHEDLGASYLLAVRIPFGRPRW